MMKEKTKVRSWELIDDKTLVKKTDISFFKYAGATIPGPMYQFFDAESMRNGERWEIRIRYEGSLYDAQSREGEPVSRTCAYFLEQGIEECVG